jgi:hypothetical protein
MFLIRGETVSKGFLVALSMAVLTPALAYAQQPAPELQPLRKQVLLMEGLLARAGTVAADTIARRLTEVQPGLTAFIGPSRARGFIMDGYGIFFHVEVPALSGTVIWTQQVMQRELQFGNALSSLKRAVNDMPEGPGRQQAIQAMALLARQAGPVKENEVAAANVSAAIVDPNWDPNEDYKQEVRRELIDAILNHSLPLNIGPDQWLEVGAHMSESVPQSQRGTTLMIRVKGSDLAIFAADPTRREEIRKKVEVRAF